MNNRFVSLMYHSLGEKPKNQYDVSLETFFQQVKKLVDSKYIIEVYPPIMLFYHLMMGIKALQMLQIF